MSEHITHTAILDDCFRLMLISNAICHDFHTVGYAHRESARLGAISRTDDRLSVQLLASLRTRWPERKAEQRLEQKLAFVLGWLCRRAAERQMTPVVTGTKNPMECSIYHDIFILRTIYADGKRAPFNEVIFDPQAHPAAASFNAGELEELVRLLLQRALISIHALKPDAQDVEGWLERLFALRQDFTINLQRYAQVFAQPDPEKIRSYITELNFYNENDPHIRVARAVQQRDELRASYVTEALQATPASQYGRALKRGYDYLQAASDFFSGKIERESLQQRLEIN